MFDGDLVSEFTEKPQIGEGWINGGFFVFEPAVFDYLDGDDTQPRARPARAAGADGQLMAYRHDGFWQCMDTSATSACSNALWAPARRPGRSGSERAVSGGIGRRS